MLRLLRKVPNNYYGLLMVLVGLGAGLRMIDPEKTGETWLCFDKGCVTTQGYTILLITLICAVWLVVLEIRRQLRLHRARKRRKNLSNSSRVASY